MKTINREKIKNKNSLKQKIITISMASLILSGSLMLIPQGNQYFYNFEGRSFANQSQVLDYAQTKGIKTLENDTHYYYKYKGKIYSLEEKNQVLQDMIRDAKISKEFTYRNVGNYVISNSGELSASVKQTPNDKLVDVHKGKNGNSYIDLDEAIESYFDYDEVLLTENLNQESGVPIEFYNESELIQYLENNKKASLEQGEESDCYLVSGICQDEGTVKKWLKSTSTYKYRYKDYEWSNFAPAEIDKIELLEQDKVYQENIFPHSGNLNAHWLTIDNDGKGAFSGSQFIETKLESQAVNEKIQHGWTTKQSDTINIFLSPFVGFGTLVSMQNKVNDGKKPKEGEWTFLDNMFNGNDEEMRNFFEMVRDTAWIELDESKSEELYYKNIEDDLTKVGPNMDSQTKTLVFFRRLANASLLRNNSDNEAGMLKFENECKKTIRKIVDNGSENMKEIYDELFKENNPSISIDDVINMFLNPSAFQYKDDAAQAGFYNLMVKINKTIDSIMEPMESLNKMVEDHYDEKGKRKQGDLSQKERMELIDANTKMIEATYSKDQKIIADDGKSYTRDELIKINKSDVGNVDISADRKINVYGGMPSPIKSITSGFNTLQVAWELGNKFSPFKMKTMSLDFGAGQELLYTYMGFSLPLLGEVNKVNPGGYVGSIPLYKGIGNPDKPGYRVKGSYFSEKEDAEYYMKSLMIRNPEEYSEISKFNISIMDKNEEMVIEDNGYDTTEEQLDIFIDKIFQKYYANSKQRYFTDGFGNKFDNQIDALASMRERISKKQFIRKYQWKDKHGIKRNYDTFEEMKKIQDIYIENTYIDKKRVLASDLFSQIDYDRLEGQAGSQNEFYSLMDGTKKRYFRTYDDACAFVINKNQFELQIEEITNIYIKYDDQTFDSEQSFLVWVKANTTVTNKKGEVLDYAI
ncbi:hypothetical protein SSABA_v1c01640 [Spiroplasma sabaudiense Ar-1343]|uniref:Uncharacterized protein n=1 Tax=Spiroplasma sabaudiense Ar-1343 TaxID=1276257 RepID=W6A9B9_9MOLU|nr:hypothetical protein [Spiroplasma sabaudiense]AHI53576.1 hypothetical protein SSABA_v1c01640 [Spiroplasma sabaudiense Ar-1343]